MPKLNNSSFCPTCKHLLNGYQAVEHTCKPTPGDVSVCCYCNEVLEFTEDLNLKVASPDSIEECFLEVSIAQRQAREHKAVIDMCKAIKKRRKKSSTRKY